MDITQLILDDHQEQRRLFSILEQLDRTDTKSLAAMWKRLAAFLEVHAEAEEQIFYPALLRLGQGAAANLPRRTRPRTRSRITTRSATRSQRSRVTLLGATAGTRPFPRPPKRTATIWARKSGRA
jgi:Hemerythrin HHE cation binding domain